MMRFFVSNSNHNFLYSTFMAADDPYRKRHAFPPFFRVLPFPIPGAFRPMKTMFSAAACALALASSLSAATIAGRVTFVTKRGQNPVLNETVVRLEPVGVRAPKVAPARFQMITRGKMLMPHVLAIPAGSTVDFPNDDPISHNLFS